MDCLCNEHSIKKKKADTKQSVKHEKY